MSQQSPVIATELPAELPLHAGTTGQYMLLLFGVFCCATSVIMLKKSTSHPMVVAGMRLLIAAAALSPLLLMEIRQKRTLEMISGKQLLRSVPGAIFLAVHFITWAAGARMTDAANASLIVNLNPIVMPFLMAAVNRERINRGEIIGTLVAMAGVIGLMGQGYKVQDGSFKGDIVCFIAMLLFCAYIAWGRVAGRGRSLWAYLIPMYAMAGGICLAAAVIARVPTPTITPTELFMWLGLGLIPTVLGHSIFNYSVTKLRGQTISIINLSQFVYAGILAFFIFGEVPSPKLYVVAVVIAVGAVIVIRSSPPLPAEPD